MVAFFKRWDLCPSKERAIRPLFQARRRLWLVLSHVHVSLPLAPRHLRCTALRVPRLFPLSLLNQFSQQVGCPAQGPGHYRRGPFQSQRRFPSRPRLRTSTWRKDGQSVGRLAMQAPGRPKSPRGLGLVRLRRTLMCRVPISRSERLGSRSYKDPLLHAPSR